MMINFEYELACKLDVIRQAQQANDYDVRNLLIYEAITLAIRAGYDAGIRIDLKEPEWPVAYIELPQGQVTWHLPQHVKAWDEHTDAQKDERLKQFITFGSKHSNE